MIGFFLSFLTPFAQKTVRDSLIKEIDEYPSIDSVYIDLLNDLSFEFIKSNPSKSLPFINKAIRLADSLKYGSGLIRATTNKGNSFWVVGLHDQALSYYLLAISQGAIDYPSDYARLNNNIGEVFKKKKLYDSSLNYYNEGIRAAMLVPDEEPVILTCNVAEAFLLNDKIDSAEYYFNLGLRLANQTNHLRGRANALFGLSEIRFRKGSLTEAIQLQNQSLELGRKIDDVRGVIQSHQKLSEYYLSIDRKDSAEYHMNQAMDLSKAIDANDLLLEASYTQYQLLTAKQQYQQAAQALNSYQVLKDSLMSLEFSTNVERIKSSLLAEISSKENQLLIQSQQETERISRTRLIFLSIFSVLLIIILCLIYFFRESKRLLKHEKEKDFLIEKLSLRNKNLQEFNSVISHNLREPLTQIIGYSKFYENRSTEISTDDIVRNIRRSSYKIDQTIRDLSTVLNDTEPDVKDYKEIDLEKTIQEVVANFDENLHETRPSISVDIRGISFSSYKPFIQDIFHHLISNTIRFRSNDRELKVHVKISQSSDGTVISFSDNGIGIDLERAKGKIFKMYQKFHPETQGRGVGLYIVKNRVDLLRGEISVQSEIGVGTTFTIRLPLN